MILVYQYYATFGNITPVPHILITKHKCYRAQPLPNKERGDQCEI